jgi:hypothetical protein
MIALERVCGILDTHHIGYALIGAAERPVDVVVGKQAWQARAIERAERLSVGPPVVLARDLILLKLYAGGAQDLWDIRALLQQHDRALESEVAADLSTLPPELQRRWESVRSA